MGKKNNSTQNAVPGEQPGVAAPQEMPNTEAAAVDNINENVDNVKGIVDPGTPEMPGTESYQGLTIADALKVFLDLVDPELRTDNPVWHWALCDDHCTFVFRDGRKTVISIQ